MPRVTSNNQTIAKNATLGLDHVVGPLSYTLPPSSTTPRSQPSQVVIESPVPVLLDVYADWCGPCKQLGPMLEEMAMRSGGMFRLAKVNSDKNRGVSDVLQVCLYVNVCMWVSTMYP